MLESINLIEKLGIAQKAIEQEINQNIHVYQEIVIELQRICSSIDPQEVAEAIQHAEKFQGILQRKIECLSNWKQEYLASENEIKELKKQVESDCQLQRTKRLILEGNDNEIVVNLEELAQLLESNIEIKSLLEERVKRMVKTLLVQQEENRIKINGLLKDLVPILNRLELWNVVGKLLQEEFVDLFIKKVIIFFLILFSI
jgi:hypothetical protein